MRKHHPKNERIKRKYLAFLEGPKGMVPTSVDQAAAAIAAFEASTRWRDFAAFHIEQARAFKANLTAQINPATGKPLAKATVYSRLMALKAFFRWLAGQSGYRRISYTDAEYFNPSANDGRIATARRDKPVSTVEEVTQVLRSIVVETEIDRRDRALIAATMLTAARDDAIASFALRHVDLEGRRVFQDARSVRTKNRKTFRTEFLPVGAEIEAIFVDWVTYLRTEKQFGPDDPLFPATQIALDVNGHFAPSGLSREFWKNADAIRRIFRQRFEAAGLRYVNPHSIRNTAERLGQRLCSNDEERKAWSQNLGHDKVSTTMNSYGHVPWDRQTEIFQALRRRVSAPADRPGAPDSETIQRVLDHLKSVA
jgi:integrase